MPIGLKGKKDTGDEITGKKGNDMMLTKL